MDLLASEGEAGMLVLVLVGVLVLVLLPLCRSHPSIHQWLSMTFCSRCSFLEDPALEVRQFTVS